MNKQNAIVTELETLLDCFDMVRRDCVSNNVIQERC